MPDPTKHDKTVVERTRKKNQSNEPQSIYVIETIKRKLKQKQMFGHAQKYSCIYLEILGISR